MPKKILTSLHGRKVGLDKDGRLVCPNGVVLGDPDGVQTTLAAPTAAESVSNVTAATVTLSADSHAGKVVTLNRAAGIAVTLPAATGSGLKFELLVGTTVTSNSTTIKVANAADIMVGFAIQAADAGSTSNMWETAATDDTITFNGTTTGGIKGDMVELRDVKLDGTNAVWSVKVIGAATGTEISPFSATVS